MEHTWAKTQVQNFRTSRGVGNKRPRANRRKTDKTRLAYQCSCRLVASIPSKGAEHFTPPKH